MHALLPVLLQVISSYVNIIIDDDNNLSQPSNYSNFHLLSALLVTLLLKNYCSKPHVVRSEAWPELLIWRNMQIMVFQMAV